MRGLSGMINEELVGKTMEEANEWLKRLGYFVTDEQEQLHYINSIQVRIEKGKIVEILNNER